MKIGLSCETTVDLTNKIIKDNEIYTVPFTITLGEEVLKDDEFVANKIFNYVEKTKELPKTSAVNQEQYKKHFTDMLEKYDCIIHISLSSSMSSAYENAVAVSKQLGNQKIRVIDSMSLSTGIALLVLYARKLINEGLGLNEIEEKIKLRIPFVQASFVINKLEYLYKGGRCNSLQYFSANLLKIKPEIIVENGKMKSVKKFFGNYSTVIKSYFLDITKKFNNPDLENVFITYTTALKDDVIYLKNQLKNLGFKNIYETVAGGTISSHCGPDCLGVLYINDGKTK